MLDCLFAPVRHSRLRWNDERVGFGVGDNELWGKTDGGVATIQPPDIRLAAKRNPSYLTSVLLPEAQVGVQKRISTVISTKGQVILPKAIRDLRDWTAGTQLIVENTPEGVLLKAAPVFAETRLDDVFGVLKHSGPALSLEAMDAAVAGEAKRRARD